MVDFLNNYFIDVRHSQPHFALKEGRGQELLHSVVRKDGELIRYFRSGSHSDSNFAPWFELPQTPEWEGALTGLPGAFGRKWVCSIAGCKESSAKFTEQVRTASFRAGQMAAELGWTVLTGGLSGVMSRAAEGAKSAGGHTLGLLPGEDHSQGNPHLDFVLPTGIGYARNYLVAMACDMMICLPGGTGTLEEMCFAYDFKRPVISWGSWEVEDIRAIAIERESEVRVRMIEIMKSMFERTLRGASRWN